MREDLKEVNKQYMKSEADLKALQSVGQIVGEVLKQLTEDNCELRQAYLIIEFQTDSPHIPESDSLFHETNLGEIIPPQSL